MTPLAQRIVKDLTLPMRKRSQFDYAGLLHSMDDIHCFEISEIVGCAKDIGEKTLVEKFMLTQTFLPAKKTWIEFRHEDSRIGLLLEAKKRFISVRIASSNNANSWVSFPDEGLIDLSWEKHPLKDLPLKFSLINPDCKDAFESNGLGFFNRFFGMVPVVTAAFGALAFINSPNIIGRTTHLPHRGLEKELIRRQKTTGTFPLNAWTEVHLKVTPPEDAKDIPDYEAHLTGRKALHWVRTHLRIRNGRLEIVREHWRGDGSIGIKRSRYRVTDQTGGAPYAPSADPNLTDVHI